MTSERGTLIATLALAALVYLPAAARAEGGAQDRTGAQATIADAVAEYDAGRFEEARALFRRAQSASPSARTLRGIGMASFELRDYVEAARALAAALREQRNPLSPEQRAHVDGLLARTETFVGRFSLRLEPADAALTVDGKAAVREPDGTLVLPFGRHEIVARCATCATVERHVEVLGGERQMLEIALGPAGPAGAASGGGATVTRTVDHPEAAGAHPEAAGGRRSAGAYWLGAAAIASAAGAVAGGLWWRDRVGELDACRAAGDRCQNEPDVASEKNLATGVTLGLAAAALTTGIVAAILWSHREPAGGAHALSCIGTREGVSCALRF